MNQDKKKGFSPSAERNKDAILQVLKKYILDKKKIFEIGSGTGQHAVYFCEELQSLQWYTSDVKANSLILKTYLKDYKLRNIKPSQVFKIGVDKFPKENFDGVFTANTLHIMSWKENKTLFKVLGKNLKQGGLVFFYGPFKYEEKFTSLSNEEFDRALKAQSAMSGIRNFEAINKAMLNNGFKLIKDHEMPVNNRLMVFEKEKLQKKN